MSNILIQNPRRIKDVPILNQSLLPNVKVLTYTADVTTSNDLLELVDSNTQRIGMMYHNLGQKPIVPFFVEPFTDIDISGNLAQAIEDNLWNNTFTRRFRETIEKVRTKIGHRFTLDLISCKLTHPDVSPGVTKLEETYDINVTYSLDDTANAPAGNWIMESDNTNIEPLQFNSNIANWNHVLTVKIDSTNYSNVVGLNYDSNTKIWTIDGNISWSDTGVLSNIENGSSLSYIELGPGDTFDGEGKLITIPPGETTGGLFSVSSAVSNFSEAPLISNVKIIGLSGLETTSNSYLFKNTVKFARVDMVSIEGDINKRYQAGFAAYPIFGGGGKGTFKNISFVQNHNQNNNTNIESGNSGFFSTQYTGGSNGDITLENAQFTKVGTGQYVYPSSIMGGGHGAFGGRAFFKNIHAKIPSATKNTYIFATQILNGARSNTQVFFSNIIFDAPDLNKDGTQDGAFGSQYGYSGNNGRAQFNNIILGPDFGTAKNNSGINTAGGSFSLWRSEQFGSNNQFYINNAYFLSSQFSNFFSEKSNPNPAFSNIQNPINFTTFAINGCNIVGLSNAAILAVPKGNNADIENQIDIDNQYTATQATDPSGNATGFTSNDWVIGTADTGVYPRLRALTQAPWDSNYQTGFTISGKINFAYIAPDIILTTENINNINTFTFASSGRKITEFSAETNIRTRGVSRLTLEATPTVESDIDFKITTDSVPTKPSTLTGLNLGFDLSANLSNFVNEQLNVSVNYDANILSSLNVTADDVTKIKFLHYNSNSNKWETVPTVVNTESNSITGTFTALSPIDLGLQIKEGQFTQLSSTPTVIRGTGQILVANRQV